MQIVPEIKHYLFAAPGQTQPGVRSVAYRDKEGRYHRADGPALVEYHWNGVLSTVAFYNHGVLHRLDGIALFKQTMQGETLVEAHYVNGKPHNPDGAAIVEKNREGDVLLEKWCMNQTVFHRIGGPAYVRRDKSGRLLEQRFYLNNILHNPDGACLELYNEKGKLVREEHRLLGNLHNENGPALIENTKQGKKKLKEHYQNGMLHALGRPAREAWKKTGEVRFKHWYYRGEHITDPQMIQVLKNYKKITPTSIEKQVNHNVRFIMLDIFGRENYMKARKARVIHKDKDELGFPRKLYSLRSPIWREQDMRMLEVINSTPEPDGSYKTYTWMVDPSCNTVLDGLAWSAGLTAQEYKLLAQS